MAKLVFNIEAAGSSEIRAMDRHELHREPDGASDIDPARSHLNRVLHGPEAGPSAAAAALFKEGVRKPSAQAEKPYLRIVIGASGSYFRPDAPEEGGAWDADRLAAFEREALAWMRREFGPDLVYASVHLDEKTPHIHALVVPTYERKPRKPGRRKRGESEAEFEARKAAAENGQTTRTAGRSSHPTLSKKGSFDTLRRSLATHLEPFGIEYGDELANDAEGHRVTGAWVKEKGAELRAELAEVKQIKAAAERERTKLKAELRGLAVLSDGAADGDIWLDQKSDTLRATTEMRREAKKAPIAARIVGSLVRRLAPVQPFLERLRGWLRRPDLPDAARKDAPPEINTKAILRGISSDARTQLEELDEEGGPSGP